MFVLITNHVYKIYILASSDGLKLKRLNDEFVYYKHAGFHFSRHYLMDWSGVDYCDVLSAIWTLILTAPIHCRASIGEQVM